MSLTVPTITTLKTELADELGENASDADVMTRIERWLNETFEDICSRQADWKFLRSYKELILAAPYSTGTVTVNNGSATVTGSGTTFDTSWKHRMFWIPSHPVNYLVASVDSTTQLTLESAWQGSNLAGQSYFVVQHRYPLDNQAYESGVIQFVNPSSEDPLEEVDIEIYIRRMPLRREFGQPQYYAVWGQEDPSATTNPNAPLFYPSHYPSSSMVIPYWFHKQFERITGTGKFPLAHRFLRPILTLGVKMRAGKYDDEQVADMENRYEGMIGILVRDNSKAGDRIYRLRERDLPISSDDEINLGSKYPRSWGE